MAYVVTLKVGDYFRWEHDGQLCKVLDVRDNGIEICFEHVGGPCDGNRGYTLLPQRIFLVSRLYPASQ